MTDRSSRHVDHPTYRRPVPGRDGEVELYEPRFRTRPPAAFRHEVEGADRLDLLAHRYLGDPHRYWLIADANPDVALERLEEPGAELAIPGEPA